MTENTPVTTTEKPLSVYFQPSESFKPFHRPWCYEDWLAHESIHWLPREVPLGDDVSDWHNNLTPGELNLVTHILKYFTQQDVEVSGGYMLYMQHIKLGEALMMMRGFLGREQIHIDAYSHLTDTIGLPEEIYSDFLKIDSLREMHNYLNSVEVGDTYQLLLSLAIFSGMAEGMTLFGSFVMLLNFTRRGKMRGMGQIVAWSIKDENCVSDDTEVLTDSGWKLFKDLNRSEKLAQFDAVNGNEITFAFPTHYTEKPYSGDMVRLRNEDGTFDIVVTPGHDVVVSNSDGFFKYKASEVKGLGDQYCYPTHGTFTGELPVEDAARFTGHNGWAGVDDLEQTSVPYNGTVYCATMPKGTLITRRNGVVSLIGNCHVDSMTRVFRELVEDVGHTIDMAALRSDIARVTREMVDLEEKFIDVAYELGDVEGLSKDEVKQYVRFIADVRLKQLGMSPIYNLDKDPLPWVNELVYSVEHANFFENRATEYSRASTQGTWEDAFK